MPKIHFGKVNTPGPEQPLPDGEYVCRVERVERTATRRGAEMWKLRLIVQDDPYKGRTIRDNLVFSPEAMPRVKLLCESLGIDTSGEVDLVPDMIKGGVCRVHVGIEEYQGTEKNKVLFLGYSPVNVEGEV